MSRRVTIERILRDDDDSAGQSIRQWKIEAERSVGITLRDRSGAGFLSLRVEDIPLLVDDLNAAAHEAKIGKERGRTE